MYKLLLNWVVLVILALKHLLHVCFTNPHDYRFKYQQEQVETPTPNTDFIKKFKKIKQQLHLFWPRESKQFFVESTNASF